MAYFPRRQLGRATQARFAHPAPPQKTARALYAANMLPLAENPPAAKLPAQYAAAASGGRISLRPGTIERRATP